jgi:threonyl-tRNA synthetase
MTSNGVKKSKIETIRHSLAHVMALAVKNLYGEKVKFGVGPVLQNGFYYDFDLGKQKITPEDLPKIENEMRRLVKQNLAFKKEILPLSGAAKFFKNLKQDYKLKLLQDLKKYGTTGIERKKLAKTTEVSIYKSGGFADLCAGPHVKSTKEIDPESFKLKTIAGAYWRGEEKNPMLTRIYGIAFETEKELDDHLKLQEEAEKRDHRKIGERLDLFSFHDIAPGSVFWHPKGMLILNELRNFIRELQKDFGYLETATPILVKKELYKISGHWEHYRENIFPLEIEKETYALKPMNCPGSTFIYNSKIRSYKDLPLRFAEFGYLHRRERSGALTGLFRVYGFIQDDAHIYCRQDQIFDEIRRVLELITLIHKTFDLKTSFALSTKPDDAMGDPKLWSLAEKDLKKALEKNNLKYEIHPKDGVFYGPKIDVNVEDSLGREWTLATIQLDFQMPERFKLYYINEKGEKKRPVMIHRSSIGSFERFIGILIEHYAGAFPFWLAPTQIIVIPISEKHFDHAQNISEELKKKNFRVEIDDSAETLSKRVRDAEIQKIPYVIVIGDKEVSENKINVRSRDEKTQKIMTLEEFMEKLKSQI